MTGFYSRFASAGFAMLDLSTVGLFMTVNYADTWDLSESNETKKAAGFGHTIALNPKRPNLLYLAGTTVLEVEIGN
jgi:hypothetical protein